MQSELITVPEVARILGRSPRAIKARAKRGTLPYIAKLAGQTGAYLFDRATIEALADIAASNREAAESVRGAA